MSDNVKIIAAIRRRFGTKYKLVKGSNGVEYTVCCPFCRTEYGSEDRKYKLYINPSKGVWRCWRCNKSGTVYKLLGQIYSRKKPVASAASITALHTNILTPGELVALTDLPMEHPAIKYLKGRDFDPSQLNKNYGVRFCTNGIVIANRFSLSNTIVFPMWINGKLVGWQTRLIYEPDKVDPVEYGFAKDEDGDYIIPPKYMTSPGLDKGRMLFNYDYARKYDTVIICEGVFDAVRVGLNAVATLGKGVTDHQARLIKAYWREAIILLDPGDADAEAKRLHLELTKSMPCSIINLKGYKDAGDAPTEEIWRQINEQKRN